MLYKARIPIAVGSAALSPEQGKLGNGVFNKIAANTVALENFKGIEAGLPVVANGLIARQFNFLVLLFFPAATDILAKRTVPRAAGFARVAVMGDKLGQHGVDKRGVDLIKAG